MRSASGIGHARNGRSRTRRGPSRPVHRTHPSILDPRRPPSPGGCRIAGTWPDRASAHHGPQLGDVRFAPPRQQNLPSPLMADPLCHDRQLLAQPGQLTGGEPGGVSSATQGVGAVVAQDPPEVGEDVLVELAGPRVVQVPCAWRPGCGRHPARARRRHRVAAHWVYTVDAGRSAARRGSRRTGGTPPS
jgi:hypothetical protein